MKLLAEPNPGTRDGSSGKEALSAKQWAVVKYTDAMTKDVRVKDDIFAELKRHFSDQEVVEITATVSCQVRYPGSFATHGTKCGALPPAAREARSRSCRRRESVVLPLLTYDNLGGSIQLRQQIPRGIGW